MTVLPQRKNTTNVHLTAVSQTGLESQEEGPPWSGSVVIDGASYPSALKVEVAFHPTIQDRYMVRPLNGDAQDVVDTWDGVDGEQLDHILFGKMTIARAAGRRDR